MASLNEKKAKDQVRSPILTNLTRGCPTLFDVFLLLFFLVISHRSAAFMKVSIVN